MGTLTITEAQKKLGFARSYVYALIYSGHLKARRSKKGHRAWKISAASVRNYRPAKWGNYRPLRRG